MSVEVKPEPASEMLARMGLEDCVCCGTPSRTWMDDGAVCVCEKCAKVVTRVEVEKAERACWAQVKALSLLGDE